jgi:serine protease AprX
VIACSLCGAQTTEAVLREAAWVSLEAERRLRDQRPEWRRADGACPACVQQAVLSLLLETADDTLDRVVQAVWPLDAEAAFGALPTPLRLRADPRFTGRGITMAIVDAAFYPHDDLVRPSNRVRAWVNAGSSDMEALRFAPHESPRWPGWDLHEPAQWHGLMTSAAAAGNGWSSHGLYRGMAPDADLVLVEARDPSGHIAGAGIARALAWLDAHRDEFGISVVNVSLGADVMDAREHNAVDAAVARLVGDGVVVVVAAGNDGERWLLPPASAPAALTIGGLDDRNVLARSERALWHSRYGVTRDGFDKPELVAPSVWVVAPVLPGTGVAREASELFARRANGDASVEGRIAELKLVTPFYQHVEGTSFASPIVAGTVACMREANPSLSPRRVRELLVAACHRVEGAPPERQGAGALDAGRAVLLAAADRHRADVAVARSPVLADRSARFVLHDHRARSVQVVGSWDGWRTPGVPALAVEPGLWEARLDSPPAGEYAYKFLVDEAVWLADPANPARQRDGHGGWNSSFVLPVHR